MTDTAKDEAKKSQIYLNANPAIDIEPLEKAYGDAEEMKSFIRSADDLKAKEAELATRETESQTLTDKIEYIRTKPQMLLAQATIPIKGITVDGQGNVLVYGRPPINLSGGERIRFAVNAARETANPDFKLILINGFEALSPTGQKEFIRECTGDGYRYIITKVSDGALRIVSISESGKAVDAETGEEINFN
jgi:flagellar motor switch/type III secretory pathway protein FliN